MNRNNIAPNPPIEEENHSVKDSDNDKAIHGSIDETNNDDESILYVELLKALYGTMQAALLFWKKLSSQLVAWEFEINPYDWCVANKITASSAQSCGT